MERSIADGSRAVPEEHWVGRAATHFGGRTETGDVGATHLSLVVSLGVNCIEATALGVAAFWTGSVALRAQTAANTADVAVGIFLLVGVLSSVRPPDDTHPLGHGRERFFWSLFAALGIFVGGGGLAVEGAVASALHPAPVDHFAIAYAVLLGTVALDAFALEIALRPLRQQATQRSISVRALLRRTTDPAAMTVVVGGGCAVVGALVAGAGLVVSQATGSATPDTVASALIGLLLFAASVILLRTNRDLLLGRGVPASVLREMRDIVASQPGIIDVPDLFAVVVGPSSLIVDGDVTFADALDVPAVEQTIARANSALRERWPNIEYVYLTPVARARPRRATRSVVVSTTHSARA